MTFNFRRAVAGILALSLAFGVAAAQVGPIGPTGGGGGTTFTGGVLSSGTSLNDDLCFTLGTTDTSASPCLRYDTTQTVDAGMLLTGTVGNAWVIAERQDETFDFAHAQQTTPTLFIHSNNQNTTQWLSLTHDGTNAVIQSGAGDITTTDRIFTTGAMTIGPGQGSAFQIKNGSAGGNVLVDLTAATRFAVSSDIPILWASTAAADSGTYDAGFARNADGVIRVRDATATAIRGLLGGGTTVASATALPVPTGRVFHVSGTTTVTSITSTNFESGACISIIFDGVLTFTDGGNLVLAGNFVTTADDTISLCYDGTNWYETGRAVN